MSDSNEQLFPIAHMGEAAAVLKALNVKQINRKVLGSTPMAATECIRYRWDTRYGEPLYYEMQYSMGGCSLFLVVDKGKVQTVENDNEAIDDMPVRLAQYNETIDLLPSIPDIIPNSTERTSANNLRWMMNRVMDEYRTIPVDKAGRWIGFVHGVLALAGFLDVDEVRNRSRGRYHQAYKATKQLIPETKNLEDSAK